MYRILSFIVFCLITSSLFAQNELLVIDRSENPRAWQLSEGSEFPGAKGKLYLDPVSGKMTIEGAFTQASAYVAAVFISPLPKDVHDIQFKITPETDCDVALRACDAQERYFQTKITRLKAKTTAVVSIDLASSDWSGKWGGKRDKSATLPQTPYRSVALNAIRIGKAESVKITIEQISAKAPEYALKTKLLPERPFALLHPDSKEQPVLQFKNGGLNKLDLTGTVTIIDHNEKATSLPLSISIDSGGTENFTLPYNKNEQGVWRVLWNLKDATSNKEFIDQDRFANMIPAGVTPSREKGFLFSVSTHILENKRGAETEAQAASLCGAKVIRDTLKWNYIQPSPEMWNYDFHDNVVNTLDKYNLEMQAILLCIPGWAYDKKVPLVQTRKIWADARFPQIQAFQDYVQRTAERYRGKIRYYEVMNEPDLEIFANYPVENYMELLKTAYSTIKAVDSSAHVMNGGIAWMGSERSRKGLVKQILDSNDCDIFAFHGHGSFELYTSQIQQLNKILTAYGRPWYANETAISSVSVGELIQARTLYYKLIYTWAEGAIGYTWYDLFDDGINPHNGEHHFGLLTHDAKPKTAYLAYNALATHFRGAEFLKQMETDPGVYSYLFRASNGDYLLATWNVLAAERLFQISGIKNNLVKIDLMGNKTPLSIANQKAIFKAGGDPITLRFSGEVPQLEELLSVDQALIVKPGMDKTFAFKVKNPDSQSRTYDIKCIAPANLSVAEDTQKAIVPPGKTHDFRFKVKVSQYFLANPAVSPKLTLQVTMKGFNTESIAFPIMIENIITESDYPKEPQFVLDHASQYHSYIVNQPNTAHLFWTGPDDLNAKIYLSSLHNALRIKAVITDDKHVQPYNGMDVWQGDNIQLAMKLPKQSAFWELGLTHLKDGKSEVCIWQAPEGYQADKVVKQIKLKTSRNEISHQTIYEAEVPFTAIGLTNKIGKDGFQFNLIVNDNDGEVREGFIGIAPGLGEDKNPSKYPVVRFE